MRVQYGHQLGDIVWDDGTSVAIMSNNPTPFLQRRLTIKVFDNSGTKACTPPPTIFCSAWPWLISPSYLLVGLRLSKI